VDPAARAAAPAGDEASGTGEGERVRPSAQPLTHARELRDNCREEGPDDTAGRQQLPEKEAPVSGRPVRAKQDPQLRSHISFDQVVKGAGSERMPSAENGRLKEDEMAVSDQLTSMAARAKEAEDRAAAADGKAKADLERDVENARTSAQAQADKLRETADAKKGELSGSWNDMQQSWDQHIEKVRSDIETRRGEHDVARAQRKAENAEDDAVFAVDYAYAAIVQAEYSALDASRARMEADELAAGSTSSGA
jgi:hypothetical protein